MFIVIEVWSRQLFLNSSLAAFYAQRACEPARESPPNAGRALLPSRLSPFRAHPTFGEGGEKGNLPLVPNVLLSARLAHQDGP